MSNLKALRELIIKTNYPYDDLTGMLRNDAHRAIDNPITLSEVLMALPNYVLCGNKYALTERLRTKCLVEVEFKGKKYSFWWDLNKDLDGQSPETIQKLLTLIEKHND
jgi:hypothetical protein